jgi:L-lactate utilization protein LutC
LDCELHVQVFEKAVQEAQNGMGPGDLGECCGAVKAQLSVSNVHKTYTNVINTAQSKMEEAYEDICRTHKLEEIIRKSMNSSEGAGGSAQLSNQVQSTEAQFGAMITEEKEREKERLNAAIQQLELEVRRNRETLSRLKSQVQNEIAAATEECQKMAMAAAQLTNASP